ncbi:MAG: F0F1 ATP synthase subunit beta, partial [Desulfovermiculus sp.]
MSEKVGKISQVIGAVVDLEFPEGQLPNIRNSVRIKDPQRPAEEELIVEVAQQLGDNIVRCIAMDGTEGLVRGMEA